MAFGRRDLVPPWGIPGGHRDRSPSTTVPWTQDLETPTGDGARFAASGEGICGCPPSTMISEEGIWHPPSSPQVGWHSPGGTRMAPHSPSSTTILREDAGSPSSPGWEGCSWVWWGGTLLEEGLFLRQHPLRRREARCSRQRCQLGCKTPPNLLPPLFGDGE